jgi:SAM-dependent methyltransferase
MTESVTHCQSLYADPEAYDIAYGWDSRAETAHLLAIAGDLAGRPVRRALELGCGTGRVLRELAALGVTAIGLDRDPAMLEFAARRLDELNLTALSVLGDMRDFRLVRPVDFAISPINGVGYLTGPGELARHIGAVACNLTRGGMYVVELRCAPVEAEWVGRSEPWTFTRGRVAVTADFVLEGVDAATGLGTFVVSLAVTRAGKRTHHRARHTLRLWDQPQLYAAIAASPLVLAAVYRRDFTPLDPAAPLTYADDNVFFVLRRP